MHEATQNNCALVICLRGLKWINYILDVQEVHEVQGIPNKEDKC